VRAFWFANVRNESASRAAARCPRVARRSGETLCGFVPYAEQHLALIERFGRFPHRNRALGRRSTAEEEAFLAEGAESYGQR